MVLADRGVCSVILYRKDTAVAAAAVVVVVVVAAAVAAVIGELTCYQDEET